MHASFATARVPSRYLNNPREALRHFSAARRDAAWCTRALLAMAEVYICPEQLDAGWGAAECSSSGGGGSAATADALPAAMDADSTREAMQAASKLLHQLRPADMQSSRFKVFGEAYPACKGCKRPST